MFCWLKKIAFLLCLIVALCAIKIFVVTDDFPIEKNFRIHQGINFNEWLEKRTLDSTKLDTLITYEKILMLKKWGFDYVRIPINEEIILDDSLKLRSNVVNVLLDRIDFCIANGIKVVIDLHNARTHKFWEKDNSLFISKNAGEKFIDAWTQLQNVFIRYSTDSLAYECLNEPAASIKNHSQWNQILKRWIAFIRIREPKRFLFIGSNRGNQIWTFKYLDIPKNDPYLVLTFHFYEPHLFTHYKAPWSKHGFYKGPIHYPGKILTDVDFELLPDSLKSRYGYTKNFYDKEYISKRVQEVIDIAKKFNLQLNLGEFGCLRSVPDSSRYQWLKDVTSVMVENGISYTLWGLNGAGFGIWDYNKNLDTLMLQNLRMEK